MIKVVLVAIVRDWRKTLLKKRYLFEVKIGCYLAWPLAWFIFQAGY